MVSYDWAKEEYKQLQYADKKVRLMTLFEIFREHSVSITKMLPLLQADQMKEEEMIQAYESLVDAIQSVEASKLQKSLSQLDSLHAQMEALRQKEAAERAQENPDGLLDSI